MGTMLQERAGRTARHAAGRDHARGVMASNTTERGARLQRDTAVHEALMKRKVRRRRCVGAGAQWH